MKSTLSLRRKKPPKNPQLSIHSPGVLPLTTQLRNFTKNAYEYAQEVLSPSLYPKVRLQVVSDLHLELPPERGVEVVVGPEMGRGVRKRSTGAGGWGTGGLGGGNADRNGVIPEEGGLGLGLGGMRARSKSENHKSTTTTASTLQPPEGATPPMPTPPPTNSYTTYLLPPRAPYLLLSGDIGLLKHYPLYLTFLKSHLLHFQQIYLVLGNHEFYGLPLGREEGLKIAHQFSIDTAGAVQVLNRTRIDIRPDGDGSPGIVTLLGCTLHSYISPSPTDPAHQRIKTSLNDFKKIGGGWDIAAHNAEFVKDVTWLKETLVEIDREDSRAAAMGGGQGQGRRIVVMTHHSPTFLRSSKKGDEGSLLGSAFCTELLYPDTATTDLDLMSVPTPNKELNPPPSPPSSNSTTTDDDDTTLLNTLISGGLSTWPGSSKVSTWIFGHTHFCTDYIYRGAGSGSGSGSGSGLGMGRKGGGGGVRIVSNQRGYWVSREGEGYDPGFVIEV